MCHFVAHNDSCLHIQSISNSCRLIINIFQHARITHIPKSNVQVLASNNSVTLRPPLINDQNAVGIKWSVLRGLKSRLTHRGGARILLHLQENEEIESQLWGVHLVHPLWILLADSVCPVILILLFRIKCCPLILVNPWITLLMNVCA